MNSDDELEPTIEVMESSPALALPRDASMALVADRLVDQARAEGVSLTGDGGLLTGLVQQVLQTALEAEITDHLGYEPHAVEGRGSGNSRNGHYPKTVRTEVGDVRVAVPRDRGGTFEPVTVPVGQRRLSGLDQMVISLYAKGLTTGDIASHLFDVYDQQVDPSTISRITDAIVADMESWQSRPLDAVYPVLLVDGIRIKIRDGTVSNRLVYVVMGVNLDGKRDVLGLWVGPTGGESPKFWLGVFAELKNRGVNDVLVLCCDGLKGLPDSARATWPLVDVQLCVVHLVRNSLRYASKKHRGQVTKQLKTIYTAPSLDAAETAFTDFADDWDDTYPAMIKAWRDAWDDFVPFLEFPAELRKIVYSTNAIESLNARFRKAAVRRGHFPTEQAALKVLYLTAIEGRKNRQNPTGRINGWKSILNTLTIHYGDRLAAANQ
ncbi:MAG: IS256 family transposase [Acidimicrobiales bacterium]|nr:IS256 family transposase [Acidimicrobiales bacterium]